jgi:hypothetical protein
MYGTFSFPSHCAPQLAMHQAGGRYSATGIEEPATAAPLALPAVLNDAVAMVTTASISVRDELLATARRTGVGEL